MRSYCTPGLQKEDTFVITWLVTAGSEVGLKEVSSISGELQEGEVRLPI